MSKVLIAGASGFIGSVLVGKLLNEGHVVTAIDNLMYSQQSLLQYIPNPNFKFIWGDVNENEFVDDHITDCDVFIPLASVVGAPACSRFPQSGLVDKSITRYRLRNKTVIYPMSNSGYGCKNNEEFCTEDSLLEPISKYGLQKVEVENWLFKHHPNTITLRLATVFGVSSRMRLDLLVNFFVWKAVTEGVLTVAEPKLKRNYVHINDVCDCFIHCINNFEVMKGNAYNLGLNTNHSKGELAEIVRSFTGCEILETKSYKDPDKRNYIVSNQKINDAGFIPSVEIEDAIPNLIEACRMIKMLNYGRELNRNA